MCGGMQYSGQHMLYMKLLHNSSKSLSVPGMLLVRHMNGQSWPVSGFMVGSYIEHSVHVQKPNKKKQLPTSPPSYWTCLQIYAFNYFTGDIVFI